MNQSVIDAKKVVVEEIQSKIASSSSTVVVEYRGLSVAQLTTLRRKLRAENIEFKVYKNSMSQRAAEAVGYGDLVPSLTGPNAMAFSNDAVAPARVLAEFAKKNKALIMKSGIVEGKVVDAAGLSTIATLPNRDGMISMLLGMFQSPVRNFAYAISQIAEKKEQ
ncbi:MAG: 50S ribosomal protein L10 [Erysipelotrichia bacterium]|jgi:large subunit ribosomal protein L10|nr:50S ribosomal protein L10 [Erysipelotrichia bacterium]